MTLHPHGKKGVNLMASKYQLIKDFILAALREKQEISFDELTNLATEKLNASFDGKVVWYIVTDKLDLEARGIIERVPKTSPH